MSQLSDRVLALSIVYLGPAAKMFLDRQTNAHMKGLKFEDISPSNLPDLAKWISISAGLLIGKEQADEFAQRIKDIR